MSFIHTRTVAVFPSLYPSGLSILSLIRAGFDELSIMSLLLMPTLVVASHMTKLTRGLIKKPKVTRFWLTSMPVVNDSGPGANSMANQGFCAIGWVGHDVELDGEGSQQFGSGELVINVAVTAISTSPQPGRCRRSGGPLQHFPPLPRGLRLSHPGHCRWCRQCRCQDDQRCRYRVHRPKHCQPELNTKQKKMPIDKSLTHDSPPSEKLNGDICVLTACTKHLWLPDKK